MPTCRVEEHPNRRFDGHAKHISKYSMKCPTSLCEAMVVLSLYKKTQIGYTQYVDNDVYVDDVDDDEAGAGAYFFLLRHSDAHINCERH